MTRSAQSPRISELRWGRIRVAGAEAPLRDAVLFPGGGHEWDWRITRTGHVAGIAPAAVRELLARGATEVVLARGWLGLLRIAPQTCDELARKKIPFHVLRTPAAVRRYNRLVDAGVAVGALIHSTC